MFLFCKLDKQHTFWHRKCSGEYRRFTGLKQKEGPIMLSFIEFELIWSMLPLLLSAAAIWISLKTQKEWRIWKERTLTSREERQKPTMQSRAEPHSKRRLQPPPRAKVPALSPSKAETSALKIDAKPIKKVVATMFPSKPNAPTTSPHSTEPSYSWEMFMGARLFAWIGGLALFFAISFFVKYSFDHNLIPPALRVTIGYAMAAGLVIGGMRMNRKPYKITSHTLTATGIVGLYAVSFAAHSVYHFHFFSLGFTFVLMSLVTTGAIILADRWRAQIVAGLGLLGGFITPLILNSQTPQVAALFTYIGLLNIGVLVVSIRQQWPWMVWVTAIGTMCYAGLWVLNQTASFPWHTAIAIFIPFSFLFALAENMKHRKYPMDEQVLPAFQIPSIGAMGLAWIGMAGGTSTNHPAWSAVLILATTLCLMWQSIQRTRLTHWDTLNAGVAFLALSRWTYLYSSDTMTGWVLGVCLVFGLMQSAHLFLQLKKSETASMPEWKLFPPLLSFFMVGISVFRAPTDSYVLWPVTLLIGAAILLLSFIFGSMMLIIGTIVLSMGLLGYWILTLPVEIMGTSGLFAWILAFSVFFLILIQKMPGWLASLSNMPTGKALRNLPSIGTERLDAMQLFGQAYTILLHFMLLLGALVRMDSPPVHWVMGISFILSCLAIWVSRKNGSISLVGLGAALTIQWSLSDHYVSSGEHHGILVWILAHYAVFLISPFIMQRGRIAAKQNWIASALSGVGHFFLMYVWLDRSFDWRFMGLLPAAFALVSLSALYRLWPQVSHETEEGRGILAWFGGVSCLFVTLIFPIQWSHEWLTVGWALEGAALVWLYRCISHRGLLGWGIALMSLAFIRLGLNPDVIHYHPRGEWPILNWYLYTYSVAAASMFFAATCLKRYELEGIFERVPAWLSATGGVLCFLLMNIEIADFFAKPGSGSLVFEFTGNFARDLCYSISWSLFAFLLIVLGIAKQLRETRWAGLGLLGVTLGKVFFHDISHLNQLYRVGALVGVAVVAIFASFLYQKYAKSLKDVPSLE
jgi:uncharacterized membrane protein